MRLICVGDEGPEGDTEQQCTAIRWRRGNLVPVLLTDGLCKQEFQFSPCAGAPFSSCPPLKSPHQLLVVH